MRKIFITFLSFAVVIATATVAHAVTITVLDAVEVSVKDSLLNELITGYIAGGANPPQEYGGDSLITPAAGCQIYIAVEINNENFPQGQNTLTIQTVTGAFQVQYNWLFISTGLVYHLIGSGDCADGVTSTANFSFNGVPEGDALSYTLSVDSSVDNGKIKVSPAFLNSDMGLQDGSLYKLVDGTPQPIYLGSTFEPYRTAIETEIKNLLSSLLTQFIGYSIMGDIEDGFNDIVDFQKEFSSLQFDVSFKLKNVKVLTGLIQLTGDASLSNSVALARACSRRSSAQGGGVVPHVPDPPEEFTISFNERFVGEMLALNSLNGYMCKSYTIDAREFLGIFPELIGSYAGYEAKTDSVILTPAPPLYISVIPAGGSGRPLAYVNMTSVPVTSRYLSSGGGGIVFRADMDLQVPLYLQRDTKNGILYVLDVYNIDITRLDIIDNPLSISETAINDFLLHYALPVIFSRFVMGKMANELLNPKLTGLRFSPYPTLGVTIQGIYFSAPLITLSNDADPPTVNFVTSLPWENNVNSFVLEFSGADNVTPENYLRYKYRFIDASGIQFPWSREMWKARDGNSITAVVAPFLPEGVVTVEVFAIDGMDNASDVASLRFNVDTVPPFAFVTEGPLAFYSPGTFHFEYTGRDYFRSEDDLNFSYKMDDDSWSAFSGSTSVDIYLSDPGTHVFSVRARDPAGNIGEPATWVFSIDDIPPDTELIFTPPKYTMGIYECFTYRATDNVQKTGFDYFYRLDSGKYTGPTKMTSVCYTRLNEGSHVFEVYARDRAGNEDADPATYGFTVDRQPPYVTVLTAPGEMVIDVREIVFQFRVTDNVTTPSEIQRYFFIDDGYPITVTDYVRLDLVRMGIFYEPAFYRFTFKAIDRAGNQTVVSWNIYVSLLGILTRGGGCGCTAVPVPEKDAVAGWLVIVFFTAGMLWIMRRLESS